MRKSEVLITDRLMKKVDGRARVFYHPDNVPFGTPVIYAVYINGRQTLITDSREYALAFADGLNHPYSLDTLIYCDETGNQEYMDTL